MRIIQRIRIVSIKISNCKCVAGTGFLNPDKYKAT